MEIPSLLYPLIIFFLLLVYFGIPHRYKWVFLFLVSFGYYLYISQDSPFAVILIIGSITIDYILARGMHRSSKPSRILLASILLNIGVLSLFKFPGLFLPLINNLISILSGDLQLDNLVFPIGLSFYTFAKLGYMIDVYQKTAAPETNPLRLATFVSFFPNIVSGPIEKANHFLPQLERKIEFDETRVVAGLQRILWGTFKKIVVANRLAVYVDYVYNDPHNADGKMLLLATFLFTIQIYADFSGYTDIAIGIAKLFGIDLLENFNRPYFATSILDFWNRWHMSLTAWIRGYLFMPISRRALKSRWGRSPRIAQAIAYTIIMLLVAIWHGSQLTFMIWGLLHALYMVVLMLLPAHLRRPPKTTRSYLVRMTITFLLVSFAWIFFRAASLGDSTYIISHLFSFDASQDLLAPFKQSMWLFEAPVELVLSLFLVAVLFLADWLGLRNYKWEGFARPIRWASYYFLLIGIYISQLFLSLNTQQFIYRQF